MTVEWDGVERPVPQLQPFLKSADRAVRERAFRAATQPYIEERGALAGLFDRMLELRQRAARNAGFANYRDYIFPAKYRFDYTPADCERFHEAVERTATRRSRACWSIGGSASSWMRCGLGTSRWIRTVPRRCVRSRPWTSSWAPRGKCSTAVDPVLGGQFQTMIDERLLDLDSRTGKAPGGYCETLHSRGRPFIFMNAVGLVDDVMTLLHEAGHAFHAFASHRLPFIWQRHPGSEAAELASMSMELLASPHLAQPTGYFTPEDHRAAWLEHLEDVLLSLVHIASVDAFQTWIYTSPDGADASARDASGSPSGADSSAGVDWSGLERERVARWYRQLHIFMYPFYYIEYGIAQIGALQIWRNSLEGPGAGGRPLPRGPRARRGSKPARHVSGGGREALVRRAADRRAGRAGRGADRSDSRAGAGAGVRGPARPSLRTARGGGAETVIPSGARDPLTRAFEPRAE